MPEQPTRPSPPATVRWAGMLVTLQGTVAVGIAIVLVIRGLLGHDQTATSGYGTAAWFAILGGAVLAAGIALITGRRWGRTIAVVAQLLLLPVSWSLLTDSHQPAYGVLLAVVAVAALVLLFSSPSSRWMADEYGDEAS
ncbi:peptidoglycan/LPS O-acetylase OafA/YrhL [Rhodococcus sp. PvR044]|nr:peptidoglycan/LPS O-acetylase OafA/YrhL [Rhodococcus sp. PvR099]